MIDDTDFLKDVTTDGEYFYIENKRRYIANPKFAMLIMLTKLKMGFVSFDELYKEIKHLSVYDGARGVEDFFEIDCVAKDLTDREKRIRDRLLFLIKDK